VGDDTRKLLLSYTGSQNKEQSPMAEDTRILALMSVPQQHHDLDWLKKSLQAAIELEFATLPPYLCAEWSVKSGINPVRISIHAVVREEMLHFGLMCNMVAAIRGTPIINTPSAVPRYPGPLPGGVHPGLQVALRKLSKEAAEVFMKVELPEHGPLAGEEFPTIGAFFTAIEEAFVRLNPALTETNQLAGMLGLRKLRTLQEVRDAISVIKRQGEGSQASPEDTGPNDLAHYYRFGEIFHAQKLRKDPVTGKWEFKGDPFEIGDVLPMAEIPPGGYKPEDVSPQVGQLLREFDQTYTLMLTQLQTAWATGSQASLGAAVDSMMAMQTKGTALMNIAIPGATGNYGPCFRLAA
jgi:hypothetical protein